MMTGSFQQPVSANTIEVVEESKDGGSKPPRRNTVTNFAQQPAMNSRQKVNSMQLDMYVKKIKEYSLKIE